MLNLFHLEEVILSSTLSNIYKLFNTYDTQLLLLASMIVQTVLNQLR